MKYKIRATFEVTFDTDKSNHLETPLLDTTADQLMEEWYVDATNALSEKIVPNLVGHQIQLVDYRLDAVIAGG